MLIKKRFKAENNLVRMPNVGGPPSSNPSALSTFGVIATIASQNRISSEGVSTANKLFVRFLY